MPQDLDAVHTLRSRCQSEWQGRPIATLASSLTVLGGLAGSATLAWSNRVVLLAYAAPFVWIAVSFVVLRKGFRRSQLDGIIALRAIRMSSLLYLLSCAGLEIKLSLWTALILLEKTRLNGVPPGLTTGSESGPSFPIGWWLVCGAFTSIFSSNNRSL